MQCSTLVRQVSALSLALCVMKIAGKRFRLNGLHGLRKLVHSVSYADAARCLPLLSNDLVCS
jgi:hypothetical protein